MATAHIKIDDLTPRVSYDVGSAPQSVFAVPFPFFATRDLKVYVGSILQGEASYTVTGVGATGGGSLTLSSAVSNIQVVIVRKTQTKRTTDFPTSGPFPIDTLNTELDRLTAMAQDRKYEAGRAILAPDSDPVGSLELPPKAERAGQVMGFDADGNPAVVPSTPAVNPLDSVRAEHLPASGDLVHLPAIRRRLRAMPDLMDFGSVAYGDEAFNAAIAAGRAENWRQCFVPGGANWKTNAPVVVNVGMHFIGEDRTGSVVAVEHDGHGFVFNGEFGGGGGLEQMAIGLNYPTSSGTLIYAYASAPIGSAAGWSPDGLSLTELWLTYYTGGVGLPKNNIVLDGGPRNPVSGLQGIRDCHITHVQTFGGTDFALFCKNVRGLYISDVFCNASHALKADVAIIGETSAVKDRSYGVNIAGLTCGWLSINNSSNVNGFATPQAGLDLGASVENCALLIPPGYHPAVLPPSLSMSLPKS